MRIILFLSFILFLSGCATAFKGYKSSVDIEDVPDNIQIFTKDSIQIPILQKYEKVGKRDSVTGYIRYYDSIPTGKKYIQLRSKNDYILIFRNGQSEKRIELSPKLNVFWFIFDIVCGGFPIIVDATTGNWNYFDKIEFDKY